MVHTFTCDAGHAFDIDDDGKPDAPAVAIAIRQTKARLALGCDTYVKGTRCNARTSMATHGAAS
jgi:hypothetical protein